MYIPWSGIIIFGILFVTLCVASVCLGCRAHQFRDIVRKLEGKRDGNGVDDSDFGDAAGMS